MHPALVASSRSQHKTRGQLFQSLFRRRSSYSDDNNENDGSELLETRLYGSASAWLLICGISLAFGLAVALLRAYNEPGTCTMSYSRPVYHKIPVLSAHSWQPHNYRAYLYREGGLSTEFSSENDLGGTPVLFIPGNAGSYSQGRSLAAFAAELPNSLDSAIEYDFFMVHFDEDLSALHGQSLLDEARYTNDVVAHILKMYTKSETVLNQPSAVILIGHSMGGIVARTMLTMDNYVPDSVNTIITLSTPHVMPPLTFDSTLSMHYERMNDYWRRSYFLNQTRDGPNPLAKLFVLSISGGHTDFMVPPDYTIMDSLAPPENALSLFSYNIAGVLKGIDHLAVVWCAELRDRIIHALVAITDPKDNKRTLPLAARQREFHKAFLTDLDKADPQSKLQLADGVKVTDGAMHDLSIVAIDGNASEHRAVIKSSLLQLALRGTSLAVSSGHLDCEMASVQSSLVTLKVKVTGGSDATEVVLGHTLHGRETRWYPGRLARMFWYSRGPFIPGVKDARLHVRVLAATNTDTDKLVAHISVDVMSTVANIALRYRTAVATWTFACLALCMLLQLRLTWNKKRPITFRQAVDIYVRKWHLRACFAVALLHCLLCSQTISSLVRTASMVAISSPMPQNYRHNDLLAGLSDWQLWWVPVLIFNVAAAACVLLDLVVTFLNYLATRLSSRGPKRPPQPPTPKSLAHIAQELQLPRLKKSQLILLAAVAVLLCYIPFQVSTTFVSAYFMLKAHPEGYSFIFAAPLCWTWLVNGPTMVVWATNLELEWTTAFASLSNLLGVLPTLVLTYQMRRNPGPPRPPMWVQLATEALLLYTMLFCLVHGVLHSYATHRLAGILCLWFSGLQYFYPAPIKPN